MKKYDKVIFVPDDEYGQYQVKLIKDEEFKRQKYSPAFNSVVLTIEEAAILYNTGYSAGFYDAKKESGLPYKDVPDFETYLQSKGIQL